MTRGSVRDYVEAISEWYRRASQREKTITHLASETRIAVRVAEYTTLTWAVAGQIKERMAKGYYRIA